MSGWAALPPVQQCNTAWAPYYANNPFGTSVNDDTTQLSLAETTDGLAQQGLARPRQHAAGSPLNRAPPGGTVARTPEAPAHPESSTGIGPASSAVGAVGARVASAGVGHLLVSVDGDGGAPLLRWLMTADGEVKCAPRLGAAKPRSWRVGLAPQHTETRG